MAFQQLEDSIRNILKRLGVLENTPPATVADASSTVRGIVELATSAEAIAGTDTARAVTPEGANALVAAALASGESVVSWRSNNVLTATTVKMQAGYIRVQGVNTALLESSFNFQETYTGTPTVTVTMAGGRSNGGTPGTFNPSGLSHVGHKEMAVVKTVTGTGATFSITRNDGSNLNSSFEYYFSVLIIGVRA
jgi:hypothetical protein